MIICFNSLGYMLVYFRFFNLIEGFFFDSCWIFIFYYIENFFGLLFFIIVLFIEVCFINVFFVFLFLKSKLEIVKIRGRDLKEVKR